MTTDGTDPQPHSEEYGADQIQHLEGIEGIRHRPAMYIGGTDLVGLHHLVFEVTDNVLDEFANRHATTCNVQIHGDGSISIIDDGRGIPVGIMKDKQRPAVEVVFTEIHAGGKFDRKAYAVGTGGLHGVGVTAVNACSEWLEVEVRREGFVWTMEFSRGKVTEPLVKGVPTNQTGTKVTFKPDPQIFPNCTFNYDTIHKKLQDAAFLNAGIKVHIVDERTGQSDSFCYQDGLTEFVKWINRTETALHPDVIRIQGDQDTTAVDVALQWTDGYSSENIRCFANGISNSEGGTHLSGFRTALTRTLNNYGKQANLFKDMAPQGEDFREGLTAVVTVRIPNPQFESQTKIKLVNVEVEGAMNSVVGEMLAKYFEENPATAKNICQKGLRSAEAREAARKARDMIRSQNKVSGGGLPEKLRDCRSHALDISEIYLVEGDSAGGSADTGRDAGHQAILPLRGKILNVEKAQAVKVLANKEVAAIFRALGIPPLAEEVDINKRRYGKVILMTDADVDGSHIRTLLLTFLFRHMRELVKAGCVYVAQPPLYRVVAKGRKNAKPRYVQTHQEMMSELLDLGLEGTTLVLKPRVNVLAKQGNAALEPVGQQREMSGDTLRKLSEVLSKLDEPLEALERRGLSLRRLAVEHATADGLLPRFRVLHSGEEHWLANKSEVDAFLAQQQQTTGKELKTADDSVGASGDGHASAGDASAHEGNGATTITVTDLHEVRTINDTLKQMQEYGLTLNDLLPPPPRNAEVVYPYEIVGPETPRRLQTVRELVPRLRDIGDKGFIRTRFKGLGEMNPEELFETAMDPTTRILKRVALEDAAAAEEIFRVLMGEHVEPRREFIEKHALEVRDLDV